MNNGNCGTSSSINAGNNPGRDDRDDGVSESIYEDDRSSSPGQVGDDDSDGQRLPGRQVKAYKDDSQIRDQQSTGRKRAAVMYPLDAELSCEWKMQKNCGGGSSPIVGCKNGKQQARHHGPDKNTLNNDLGNVHRICHNCHNRWHTKNDPFYNYELRHELPKHNPVKCDLDDIIDNELYWTENKAIRAKDY